MAGKNKLFTPILPPPVALPKAGEREEGKGADKDRKKKDKCHLAQSARGKQGSPLSSAREREASFFPGQLCMCQITGQDCIGELELVHTQKVMPFPGYFIPYAVRKRTLLQDRPFQFLRKGVLDCKYLIASAVKIFCK